MTAPLSFALMCAADLPEVMEIERLAFASPWTPGLFLHELQLDFSRVELARVGEGGPLAGYVVWWRVADEAHILNVAVDPRYRRTGVGTALARRVLDDAVRRGTATISLDVRAGNTAARALYASLGFVQVGRRAKYYDNGEDAIIMTRSTADGVPLDDRVSRPA